MSKPSGFTSAAACSRNPDGLPAACAATARMLPRGFGSSSARRISASAWQRSMSCCVLQRGCRDAHDLATAKLAAVERRLADLNRVRLTLRELIGRCEAGKSAGCPIIEALARSECESA
jgi:hypothetical protein